MSGNWKDYLPGSFGAVDRIFAGHPLDRERAAEMLAKAIAAKATWADVEDAATEFMKANGCGEAHIADQLEAMRRTVSYFR